MKLHEGENIYPCYMNYYMYRINYCQANICKNVLLILACGGALSPAVFHTITRPACYPK
jgi:hypothetical protein